MACPKGPFLPIKEGVWVKRNDQTVRFHWFTNPGEVRGQDLPFLLLALSGGGKSRLPWFVRTHSEGSAFWSISLAREREKHSTKRDRTERDWGEQENGVEKMGFMDLFLQQTLTETPLRVGLWSAYRECDSRWEHGGPIHKELRLLWGNRWNKPSLNPWDDSRLWKKRQGLKQMWERNWVPGIQETGWPSPSQYTTNQGSLLGAGHQLTTDPISLWVLAGRSSGCSQRWHLHCFPSHPLTSQGQCGASLEWTIAKFITCPQIHVPGSASGRAQAEMQHHWDAPIERT